MKSRLWALLALCTLAFSLCPVSAEEIPDFSQGLEQIMETFMEDHNLDEANCAIGWRDLTTGNTWYFNEDAYMVAGSMYKLPLNMAIADRLASGELDPTYLTRGYQIQVAAKLSIIYSNNETAQALQYVLSDDRDTYRNILAAYSGVPLEDLPDSYYSNNCMSPEFLLNTLQHLYDHRENYQDLLENLKQAHPGRYFQSAQTDYDIAHKYGSFEGALNDCGIIYTPRPFALVAFFNGAAATEDNLGDLCALMTDYALYLDTRPTPEPEPTPPSTPEATTAMAVNPPETTLKPETAAGMSKTATRNTIAVLFGAAVLLALTLFLMRTGHVRLAIFLILIVLLAITAAICIPRLTTPVAKLSK